MRDTHSTDFRNNLRKADLRDRFREDLRDTVRDGDLRNKLLENLREKLRKKNCVKFSVRKYGGGDEMIVPGHPEYKGNHRHRMRWRARRLRRHLYCKSGNVYPLDKAGRLILYPKKYLKKRE